MRNARGFVDDYRRKGYPDDRIRIIASMRPEPSAERGASEFWMPRRKPRKRPTRRLQDMKMLG